MDQRLTPSSDVKFYPFADGGVLFLEGSRRLWALNPSSAFIWNMLGNAGSLDELADRLAFSFQVGKSRALEDVEALLKVFDQEGLLGRGTAAEESAADDPWDISATGPRLVEPASWAFKCHFQIAGRLFEFCCQDTAIGRAYATLMDHFAVNAEGMPDTRMAVASGAGGGETWDLFLDGAGYRADLKVDEVLPHLATLVFVHCCQALTSYLLFHAAVVEMNGTIILFPGEAGSGKTTLCAALIKKGACFFSDELAVINVENLHVAPFPLPMSIKQGSVKPLAQYYPDLGEHPIHSREDGKRVRYLSATKQHLPARAQTALPAGLIIFPKYIEGARNQLVEIDKIEALQRLSSTGSSNRFFTGRDVRAMITLIEKKPCYEILFSELQPAIALLKEILL